MYNNVQEENGYCKLPLLDAKMSDVTAQKLVFFKIFSMLQTMQMNARNPQCQVTSCGLHHLNPKIKKKDWNTVETPNFFDNQKSHSVSILGQRRSTVMKLSCLRAQ
jgi:hypothetical protein